MGASEIPVSIRNLVVKYGNTPAVKDVSFELRRGEIFGLLGPNGAGKTSIISTLVTLEKPAEGQVKVFGFDVTREPKRCKALTGFVPQEIINHGYFDVVEILEFHSGYFGLLKNREQIDFLLHRLGLWEHRNKKVKQLSGGMKRRLLIAKALVHKPALLLLDEPTAGVDLELRNSLWEFVRELRSEGMSILLTTHYLQEAEALCDRVGIIQDGKMRRIGDTSDLIKGLTKREITIVLKAPVPKIASEFLVSQSEFKLEFQIPAEMLICDLLLAANVEMTSIGDFQIREGNLEDAMRRVLGGENESS